MRTYTMFVCEICGNESREREDVELCQAQHVGLNNLEHYRRWKTLNAYAQACTMDLFSCNNEEMRQKEEEAYAELLAFEKKHGVTNIGMRY